MSSQDITKYLEAKTYFDSLKLPDVVTGEASQAVIYVNFDGTGNNKYELPAESSNVAKIDDTLELAELTTKYEIGIGTTGDYQLWEQAWAVGASKRVMDAVKTIAEITSTLDPGVQPYIVVTGFSRGAAEARLLMQAIDDFGIPSVSAAVSATELAYATDSTLFQPGTVRMSALLYDTVTTSMAGDFAIPSCEDSVVHLTSHAEARVLFPLTSIEPGPNAATNRLIEVQLPGVHSDIGGGYNNPGIADLNLYFGLKVLQEWGGQVTPVVPNLTLPGPGLDNITWTIHDSKTAGTEAYYLWGLINAGPRTTTYATPEILSSAEQVYLSTLYSGFPAWDAKASIPASIQSPPTVSYAPVDFGSTVFSITNLESSISQTLSLAASNEGLSAGSQWLSGYSNDVTLAIFEAAAASQSIFSIVWGSDEFKLDAEGNVLFSGHSDFQAAEQLLMDLYTSNPGEALNTAALFARCAFGLGVSTDPEYVALKEKFASIDSGLGRVLSQYDKSETSQSFLLSESVFVGQLTGTPQSDVIITFGGADSIRANSGNDVLYAGRGNDYLEGGPGADTYIYRQGDGQDSISANASGEGPADILKLEEVNSADARITHNNYDLQIEIGGTRAITVYNWYSSNADYRLKEIQFSDMTLSTDLLTQTGLKMYGTPDGNTMYTTPGWQNICYAYGGNDTIYSSSGPDLIYGGDGNDTVKGGYGEDVVYGELGADNLDGEVGNDILVGGLGNDSLRGSQGSDQYRYARGDGQDTIYAYAQGEGAADSLVFTDIASTEVTFTHNQYDLYIQQAGARLVTVNGWYNLNADYRLKSIQFTDGTFTADAITTLGLPIYGTNAGDSITATPNWDQTIYGYSGNDTLRGLNGNDVIYGGAGNDTLTAWYGDDTLYGEADNDNLEGEIGNDTLVGGAGNDTLRGNNGSDQYLYSRGDGQDTIYAYAQGEGASDTLVFTDLASADVTFTHNQYDLYIQQEGARIVTVNGWYNLNADYRLKSIQFTDGSITTDAITTLGLPLYGTKDGDSITATPNWDQTIYGYSGNDTLRGLNGNEVIYGGDGNDVIRAWWGQDLVDGGAGGDQLYGEAGNDTLIGGIGNDFLSGGSGDDAFQFNYGDAQDTITDESGYDSLAFTNLSIQDVHFRHNSSELEVLVGDAVQLKIIGQYGLSNPSVDLFWFGNQSYGADAINSMAG